MFNKNFIDYRNIFPYRVIITKFPNQIYFTIAVEQEHFCATGCITCLKNSGRFNLISCATGYIIILTWVWVVGNIQNSQNRTLIFVHNIQIVDESQLVEPSWLWSKDTADKMQFKDENGNWDKQAVAPWCT